MKKFLHITWEIISILFFLFLAISIGLWIYVKFIAPESFTELVVNLGTIEDTNGKRAVVQVKQYQNADNSGIELLDVKISGYSDTNAENIVSFGIQVIGGVDNLKQSNEQVKTTKTGFLGIPTEERHFYSFINGKLGKENHDNGKLAFYEESDNLNYANVNTAFDDFGYIRIEVNDKIYALKFTGTKRTGKMLWIDKDYTSSLSEFVRDLEKQVKSCPLGHSAKTFGYKDMFEVFEYKNGKFEEVSNQDEVYSYIYVDFEHYTTGAKTAQDSLFKQIQYNTNFIYENANALDEHFSDTPLHVLTYNDLSFTYDDEKGIHLLDVTEECFNNYKKKKLNLVIEIDIDYLKSINVAFGGIKEDGRLKELNIIKIYKIENGVKSEVNNG